MFANQPSRFEMIDRCLRWTPTFSEPVLTVEGFPWSLGVLGSYSNTLLMTAAQTGSKRLVKDLAKAGAALDAVNDDGNTATHMAFLYGWSDLGYYMVDALGCDDTVENKEGKDCYAVMGGEVEKKRPDMYLGDGALGSDIKIVYD